MDRTKVLHGPRTQTYRETNYLKRKSRFWTEPRYCMVLGLKPMGKSTTYQNQVLDRIKVLHGPRTQTYGETNYLSKSSFGQNQGIAWSSDSNLWGNQLLIEIKFWTESRYCMVLGLKPMGKPTIYKNQVFDRTKVLHGLRTQTYGETNYLYKSSF